MANSPIANSPSMPSEPRKPIDCPPDCDLPENSKANLDTKLDHAIDETFPTSDPVSVSITKGGAIDYDQQSAATSAKPANSSQAEQDTAEQLLDQVREALGDVVGSASKTAQEAYNQGERYVRQARERYPEADRYYQEGRRVVRQRVTENPWLALFIAGSIGYGLAWLIHGTKGEQRNRVPDYARTRRGYAPHRDEARRS
ncbi:DUF883 family protein [Microvirga aerophila]|uniref:DUF3618 domain-containing protein n=1 Tax=Microvirga aerophila TaxID=670291 RepID=A0A512C2X4_9HYPH|nr:hypothetical protein [Microvirga aerophila]GEO18559.1 hypothetical protein MAE02_62550 [Microvirga aerophila]